MISSIQQTLPLISRLWAWAWKFFVGGVIVITGFYANFFDLKQPNVSVEITEIQQVTSSEIDLSTSSSLQNVKKLIIGQRNDSFSYSFSDIRKKYSLDELKIEISRKKQSNNEYKEELIALKSDLDKIEEEQKSRPASTAQKESQDDLEYQLLNFDDAPKNSVKFIEYNKQKLENKIKLYDSLIPLSEAELEKYREESEKTDAKIILIAAISNSGDGATTLKPQALLRADLGQSNYLDIYLRISKYENVQAEIKPRGTNILKFESDTISSMAPQDKARFINFFKNTSPTNLYVVDVKGKYYVSNTIPFAQGIYEQKIIDGLKGFAAGSTH